MPKLNLNTPCVGVCSTVYGDHVCRGCKRFAKEVINWNKYDTIQQQDVFNRLGALIIEVMRERVNIVDENLLIEQMDKLNLRYREEQHPLTWAYYLLRAGANKIKDISKYGLRLIPPYENTSLNKLFDDLDDDYYLHAQQAFNKLKSITAAS
tara:strand:- start:93674 stop:94129 length:456 start_codon:yes stop_codon:yes gene_type:complete